MQKISTIFWDLDGTLISTNELYDQAIKFACAQINCNMTREIEDLPNGQTLLADFIFLTGLSPNNNSKILNQLKNLAILYFKTNFNNNLLIKKSLELFNYFHQLGIKQSIISNSNQELCDFAINSIGIKDKCLYCFGLESVKYGKPNPEIYLKALKAHNITNSECLVFEDSITGVNAAKSANLTVISIGLEANKMNPDYIWDINTESVSVIFNKLSKSYKFTKLVIA
ncbi:MAG TPA: HAD family phosphatase [Burkholderiales bacterium]|nr:HAD family phosphatase [Burkholderiales bacterium]